MSSMAVYRAQYNNVTTAVVGSYSNVHRDTVNGVRSVFNTKGLFY